MKKLNQLIQQQFNRMQHTGKLFRVALTGQQVWDLYLRSFTPEQNPIFRDPESSMYNCNHCKNFIRRYGNIVSINENYEIESIFNVPEASDEYRGVMFQLSQTIKASTIENVFTETFDSLNSLPYEKCSRGQDTFKLGIASNVKQYSEEEANKYGVVQPDEIRTFNHFNLDLENDYVDMSGSSPEAIMGGYRDAKNVFERAMREISLDSLNLVRDLIIQGSLLDGTPHLRKVEAIIGLKEAFSETPITKHDNWLWLNSHGLTLAKFKNELIGVICSALSEGEDLNKACQDWNKRVDPANYMKVTAPITQKQIKEAQDFVTDNGYTESFNRRFATLDDIKVSEILHSNVGSSKIKDVSIFDKVKPSKSSQHKRNEFDGVQEVSIEQFMAEILPTCSSVSVLLQNNHDGNMVSLTTAEDKASKQIFKWGNNYSWTYNGNLAGKSQIKETVKSLGGKVDGVLRFSIMWAEDKEDNSDLDAHCIEPVPFGEHIYYGTKRGRTGGNLDIDITQPQAHKAAYGKGVVENITYPRLESMENGTYRFFVNQYSARNSKGFKAEIEFDGELHTYEYPFAVVGDVQVAEVTLKDGKFTIDHRLKSMEQSKTIYGLQTKEFHKVNLVCLSPNHWGENEAGIKHYFFMLEGAQTDQEIRTFHNENLLPELADHRRVLEVLANTQKISPEGKQLSGLGFNATVRDELIVKLEGSHKRVIKIKF